MSKIRSSNTKFEQNFIVALKKSIQKKFEINVASIKGKPDIVFKRKKIAIFLDSDFWHGWQYPKWSHLLKNDFWREKISKNRIRDKKTTVFLRKNGWKVYRFWGHEIEKDLNAAVNKIVSSFGERDGKCASREVMAIIENDGKFYVGRNLCNKPQKKCPRLPGDDYSKCKNICKQSGHAEIEAIRAANGNAKGGVMYLIGHDHCCEPCLAAMKKSGIDKVFFNKYPKKYSQDFFDNY